jgi:CubicO group peptidase (beta-lactamase class C family)
MAQDNQLSSRHDERFQGIYELAEAEMKRLPIPGAVLGILFDGAETITPFGVTSLENPLPVSEDTLFQIGSITKPFLATAVMRLVEQDRLELDAPIRTYLPDLKLADESVAARVTLRHLLTHTGGWVGDYFNDFGPGEDALAKMVAKLAELPQLTPLGEVWSYNNSGFYLAGRVIEAVTGSNFEAAIKELVLDPLGMHMSFFFTDDVITHRVAIGHEVVDRKPKVARPWAIGRAAHPAGGIICNVRDLFRFARFHMGDGTAPDGNRLLARASLEQMQTPLFPSTGISSIGLSWSVTMLDGTKMISHGGGTNGQSTDLRIVPSRQFAVAVFTNSDEGDQLCDEIANAAMKAFTGLTIPEAIPIDIPVDKLQVFVGRYDSASDICEIYLKDGGLVLQYIPKGGFPTPESPAPQAPPPVRMGIYAEDRVITLDEPLKNVRGEFLRNPDGSIAWLRLGGRIHARL